MLYKDFVVAASEAYGDALIKNEPNTQSLIALYSMVSRMRMISSRPVVVCAEQTIKLVIEAYLAPNKSVLEIHQIVENGGMIDPLLTFSGLVRHELLSIS